PGCFRISYAPSALHPTQAPVDPFTVNFILSGVANPSGVALGRYTPASADTNDNFTFTARPGNPSILDCSVTFTQADMANGHKDILINPTLDWFPEPTQVLTLTMWPAPDGRFLIAGQTPGQSSATVTPLTPSMYFTGTARNPV